MAALWGAWKAWGQRLALDWQKGNSAQEIILAHGAPLASRNFSYHFDDIHDSGCKWGIMSLFSRLLDNTRDIRVNAILVVEDEPLVAFEHEHALVQAGYDVVAAVDRFPAAVQAMAGHRIDLIVVDVNLRGEGSGLDVARHARERGIAVLFSAADCPPAAQSLGRACLAKPHGSRELVRAVHVIEALIAGRPMPEPPAGLRVFDSQG